MINLEKSSHTYSSSDGNRYTAVSDILRAYQVPFNSDHWSKYKAYQELLGDSFKSLSRGFNPSDPRLFRKLDQVVDPNDLIEAQHKIQAGWKSAATVSANKGTKYHRTKELQSYKQGFEVNPFTKEKIETVGKAHFSSINSSDQEVLTSLYSIPDGFYPELIIWNNEYRIAGTADKVFIETESHKNQPIRYVDIDDYKLVKKIDTRNKYQKFLGSLSHLDDCRYNKYRLQICFYAWMLEQQGFTVRNTSFTHVNKQYKFDYSEVKPDILLILADLKNGYTPKLKRSRKRKKK